MPWTVYRPAARRRWTSHEPTKPPAPVTHTVIAVAIAALRKSYGGDVSVLKLLILLFLVVSPPMDTDD